SLSGFFNSHFNSFITESSLSAILYVQSCGWNIQSQDTTPHSLLSHHKL
ncbi:hypothetical protein A2U01_0077325, partial [Trifolium medium]|nr:hypothetical protein [Trifolium medium]